MGLSLKISVLNEIKNKHKNEIYFFKKWKNYGKNVYSQGRKNHQMINIPRISN